MRLPARKKPAAKMRPAYLFFGALVLFTVPSAVE
jgi:hypothetical protein